MTTYLAALAAVTLLAILVWRRPWRRPDNPEMMSVWLGNFSSDCYLPMLRLADHRDTGYLSMLQGHEVAARYRRVQRRLLREYLHGLSRDFHRLHTIATQGALRSRQESEISFFALAQKKIEFAFSLWIVEVRLLVDGISPCRVDLGPLLASLDQLMAKVR